jgi:NAD(P)-dependent dehydrogenase (short-subunit alcohol dehydrogenase family)
MAPQSVFRSDLFAGKVAVVTGGGSGIGKAIARELIELGARVVIAARKEPRLLETAAEIGTEDQVATTLCNIRDEEQVRAMLQFTLDRFGAIDFLVNNAGGQFPSPAALVRTKGWNAVIETNLTGTFLCCREVFGLWMEEHGGVIVNIIADMFRGFPGMVHTGAARAGVDNITKTLAVEWAHRGIRINSVAPGTIHSSGIETYDPAFQEVFYSMANNIPAQRLGTEEEVSAAVMFLLSPAAAFVTGETMRVDGGGSLWRLNWEVPYHENMPPYGGRPKSEPGDL